MKSYTLDTSFISAFLNEDNANHREARRIAQDLKHSYLLIPSVVFAELMSFSADKKFRDFSIKISMEMAEEIPSLTDENILDYIDFTANLKHSFTATDSIILFLAKINNSQLITLDKKLSRLFKNI